MRFAGMSLVEVAAAVAAHLKTHGIDVVVIGGSAITSHVPDVYTSMDIDFAVTSGLDRRKIARALSKLGFEQRGRVFVHPEAMYALAFLADRPYIDQEPVYDFAEIHTPVGSVRVLLLEDAIADRIAAFVYWSDSESLDVAERSAVSARTHLTWDRIDASLRKLGTRVPESTQRNGPGTRTPAPCALWRIAPRRPRCLESPPLGATGAQWSRWKTRGGGACLM